LVIMAPMLAIRSVTMSLATTVFVLRRPEWLLFHNLAGVLAIAAAFGFAWITKASLTQFLLLLAILQGAELLCFFALIAIAARRQYILRRSLPLGTATD
jgi:lipopolysaccharide exporter